MEVLYLPVNIIEYYLKSMRNYTGTLNDLDELHITLLPLVSFSNLSFYNLARCF